MAKSEFCLLSSVLCLLSSVFCVLCSGCASTDNSSSTKFQVISVSSRDVAVLSADDIVRVMRRAGFSDEQILELGTRLRNALLQSGAVEIKQGKMIEAIFAVNSNNVFITTRLRGNFIYNLEKASFIGLETTPSRSQPKEAPAQTPAVKSGQSILPTTQNRQYQGGGIWQR